MIEIDSVPIFIINGIGIVIDITSQGVVVILAPVILIIFTFILVGKFFIPINQNFPFLGVEETQPAMKITLPPYRFRHLIIQPKCFSDPLANSQVEIFTGFEFEFQPVTFLIQKS